MSSCISMILALSIVFFMISLLFLLFSLYHYNKYVRIEGTLTGKSNEDCKTNNSNCVEVKIIDPYNNETVYVNLLLKNNIAFKDGDKYTVYYDNTIKDITKLDYKNAFIGNDLFINAILFFGIVLLLASIVTFIFAFPPEYYSYNNLYCKEYISNRIT
jgi:hypothetical protein